MANSLSCSRAPKLLVSVRNPEEAEAALAGGAEWIDLKEPQRGPLGAVDASIAAETAARTVGRASLSAAAGELRDWASGSSRTLLEIDGISVLKLGLAGYRGRPWQQAWLAAKREIEVAGKQLAAVVYADAAAAAAPCWREVLRAAREGACRWVLIDTFHKRAGNVLSCWDASELRQVLQVSGEEGRTVVAAGRLDLTAIANLPLELVSIVGVRGAACEGGRSGRVCSKRVAELRGALSAAARAIFSGAK
jgi:uncharacterized protein (UPF0264 family)